MNNTTQDNPPIVLSYARLTDRPKSWTFVAGSFVLAAVFVITFWIIEVTTSNLILFHTQIFNYRDPEKHQFNDLIEEFAMSIPATILMFLMLLTREPRRGWRLRVPAFLSTIGGAILYSWVRWAIGLMGWRVSESADFAIAIALAIFAGTMTAAVRSRG